jgi:hypothetical protein
MPGTLGQLRSSRGSDGWEALPKAERLRKDRMWSKWMKEQEAAGEEE